MVSKVTWQQGSNQPDNGDNLATISQWWTSLAGKAIVFAQRLLPDTGDIRSLDWDVQKFDEKLAIQNPQVRGITFYWYKPGLNQERNLTPQKLEFEPENQRLYIYPQSQSQVVIRIAIPEVMYQKIELQNPLIVGSAKGENYVLLMRDKQQQLDVKIILSPESLNNLRQNLSD